MVMSNQLHASTVFTLLRRTFRRRLKGTRNVTDAVAERVQIWITGIELSSPQSATLV